MGCLCLVQAGRSLWASRWNQLTENKAGYQVRQAFDPRQEPEGWLFEGLRAPFPLVVIDSSNPEVVFEFTASQCGGEDEAALRQRAEGIARFKLLTGRTTQADP